jgi:LytS/YehU family sensor histidine kinase
LQMNPQFLFNALNGVSSLILSGETAAAESMVGGLADFLRRTLRADPAEPVALSEEFARVAAYLQLEGMRFEDQLKVELSLPDELRNVPVLPFLLQPLVENAVKYGVARSRRTVTICVTASRSLEELVLEVADDADVTPTAEPGLSIGIANIAERLAARYGARASIRAAPVQPGFVSRVRLPLT